MDLITLGCEVPDLLITDWDWEDSIGPIINDIFLGRASSPPAQTTCVAFVVNQEQDINGGEFYSKFGAQQQNTHYNSTSTLLNDQHPSDNKWFDDYVNFSEEFGSSSRSLPTNTGAHFLAQSDYNASTLYSNSFAGFNNDQQQSTEHQMQDLSGPSTSSGSAVTQFSHLNIQEPSFEIEPTLRPPIPESEYSGYCSAPGSAYSSDEWSSSSQHSAQSQVEILEEIQRECAEIERKSVSPPLRPKTLVKRRSGTVVKHSDNERVASNSSNNSLTGLGTSDRKKELNRIAATKYREKKRRERDMLSVEHKHLETRNHQLRGMVKELKSEVGYLRKLMKDMESRAQQS
jgi:hypothetical protein